MNYPMRCSQCDKVFDSHDSVADTRAELLVHIERAHPESKVTKKADK